MKHTSTPEDDDEMGPADPKDGDEVGPADLNAALPMLREFERRFGHGVSFERVEKEKPYEWRKFLRDVASQSVELEFTRKPDGEAKLTMRGAGLWITVAICVALLCALMYALLT